MRRLLAMSATLLAGVLSACSTPTLPALAPPASSLSDAEIEQRLRFIEERLEGSRRHAQRWYLGWYAASVGGVVVGGLQAGLANKGEDRASGIATAVLAAGGIAYLELLPMNARHGADPLEALPATTHAQRLAKLERAQEILEANGERATVQIDWVAHAANALVSVATGAIVWAVGGDATTGIVSGVLPLVGGEIQFWTEPSQPRRDVRDYAHEFGSDRSGSSRLRLEPRAGGLALRSDF